MAKAGCKLATVVARQGCSVCVCDHGILHVTIGSVTLRISEDSLEPIAAVLNHAVSEIRRADAAMRDRPFH
jgi:hypothetical protein